MWNNVELGGDLNVNAVVPDFTDEQAIVAVSFLKMGSA
jgi:hypothetical protein